MSAIESNRRGDGRLAGIKAGPVVSRACYTDPDIFAMEQERIFEHGWLLVAHQSEFAKPGDFRTTDIAGQPVLAVMGEDRRVRVVFNTCRHRGPIVETEREGNRKSFRCLYHHWEYGLDGALAFVPRVEGYGPGFRLEDFGLVPVPRVETFEGLIFASLDENAPPLADYLGDIAPHLASVASGGSHRLQVLGSFEYTYKANWKLICENTIDDYHVQYLHGLAFSQRAKILQQEGLSALGGHMGDAKSRQFELSRETLDCGIHGTIQWEGDPASMVLQHERTRHIHAAVFPSFLILYFPALDVTTIRVIKPVRVDFTRVLTYCLAPADASDERKKEIAQQFHSPGGPGSRVGVDDVVAFELVQKGLQARTGGDILITRGLDRARGRAGDEHAQRSFWNGWRRFMLDEQVKPVAVAARSR